MITQHTETQLNGKSVADLKQIIQNYNLRLMKRSNVFPPLWKGEKYSTVKHVANKNNVKLQPLMGKKSDLVQRILGFEAVEAERKRKKEEQKRLFEEKRRRKKAKEKRLKFAPKAFAVIQGVTPNWQNKPCVPSIPPEDRISFLYDKIVHVLKYEPKSCEWHSRFKVLDWLIRSASNRMYYLDEYNPGLHMLDKYTPAKGLTKEEEQQLDGENFALFFANLLSDNTITSDHTMYLCDKYVKKDSIDHIVPEKDEMILEKAYFFFLEKLFKPRVITVSNYALEMAKDTVETRTDEWEDYIDQLIYIYRGTYLNREDKGWLGWKGIDRSDLDKLVQTKKKRKTTDNVSLNVGSLKRLRNE